jgi:hypothetical protein
LKHHADRRQTVRVAAVRRLANRGKGTRQTRRSPTHSRHYTKLRTQKKRLQSWSGRRCAFSYGSPNPVAELAATGAIYPSEAVFASLRAEQRLHAFCRKSHGYWRCFMRNKKRPASLQALICGGDRNRTYTKDPEFNGYYSEAYKFLSLNLSSAYSQAPAPVKNPDRMMKCAEAFCHPFAKASLRLFKGWQLSTHIGQCEREFSCSASDCSVSQLVFRIDAGVQLLTKLGS